MSVSQLRSTYRNGRIDLQDMDPNPIRQFRSWLDDAIKSDIKEPNAMTLATVDSHGRAAARMVLLKGVEEDGFSFFTNYESRKGQELGENPWAALVFYWDVLYRQVRVEGKASPLSRHASETYFKSRPYLSQLGALASKQSTVLETREELETRFEELKSRYPEGQVPLPDFWGGYQIEPTALEFWQGRENRMHDRFRYTREHDSWRIERLAP
ncbi:MAG: pyridoxamine 5'-phosphate oxidase [Trueperaceae bacterium]|nr:MAG: pyridoxamine 5'-phosphate oxidase [Trueperaceae bacterium]